MKKIVSLVLIVMMLVMSFTACGSKTDKTEQPKFGLALYSQSTEYMALLANAATEKAKELDVELIINDANNDASVQLQQVETMINNGVDIVLLASVDPDACVPCVDACTEAGVPVIAVNVANNSPDVKCCVIYEPVSQGEAEMQYMIDYLGRDSFNIVILEGVFGHTAQIARSQGIQNVLTKNPGIKVLAQDSGNWMRSEGMTLMENWLINYGNKIDGVVAQNDEMAIGAINAIKAANYQIPVVSIDGIADAITAIEEGTMIATFLQDPQVEADLALNVAMKVFKGEDISGEQTSMNSIQIDKTNYKEYK